MDSLPQDFLPHLLLDGRPYPIAPTLNRTILDLPSELRKRILDFVCDFDPQDNTTPDPRRTLFHVSAYIANEIKRYSYGPAFIISPSVSLRPHPKSNRIFAQMRARPSPDRLNIVIDLQADGDVTLFGGYTLACFFTSTSYLMTANRVQQQIRFINNFSSSVELYNKRRKVDEHAYTATSTQASEADREAMAIRKLHVSPSSAFGLLVDFQYRGTTPDDPEIRAQYVRFGRLMQRVGEKCARDEILNKDGVMEAVFKSIMNDRQPDMLDLQQAIQESWTKSVGATTPGSNTQGLRITFKDLKDVEMGN